MPQQDRTPAVEPGSAKVARSADALSPEPDTLAPLGAPIPLPPLPVSAVVVSKADLLAILRLWVPTVADITALDAERFVLTLGAGHTHDAPPSVSVNSPSSVSVNGGV